MGHMTKHPLKTLTMQKFICFFDVALTFFIEQIITKVKFVEFLCLSNFFSCNNLPH